MKHSKVLEIIENRRSIRSYLNTPIPEEDLNEILETGLYAPSGKNRKPWRFLIIKDKDNELARYTEFKENGYNDYNSHCQRCDKYKAMIAKWNDMGKSHELNEEQIEELIKTY